MNEPFILELTHRGQTFELPAAFQRYGYTYRIAVSINDHSYVFEPDEEGKYRVLATPDGAQPEIGLLQAITEKLEKLQQ
jgi:hypothetical protein